jgi:hypothetical protein
MNTNCFQGEVFWVVTPYIVVVGYPRFGVPCCLHLHCHSIVLYTASQNPENFELKVSHFISVCTVFYLSYILRSKRSKGRNIKRVFWVVNRVVMWLSKHFILKMETARFSEMVVSYHNTTRHHTAQKTSA